MVAYYDPALNLTWLADANYAKTSGYDTDGLMKKWEANDWASSLTLFGSSDWRLPTVRIPDGEFNATFTNCGASDVGSGNWGTRSEMGYMYYTHLGNYGIFIPKGYDPTSAAGPQYGYGLANTGPFVNLQPFAYWNQFDHTPGQSPAALYLSFGTGVQNTTLISTALGRAWPVHDGDLLGPHQPPLLGGGSPRPSVEAIEVLRRSGKIFGEAALAQKTYAAGDRLRFRVTFSEPVVVTGRPTLRLEIGAVASDAVWKGEGNRTRSLTFSLRINAGDFDARGVRIAGPLGIADGASIRSAAGIDANPTASGDFPGVRIDSVGPSVARFDPLTVGPRGRVTLRVQFDGPVRVAGSPVVPFMVDGVRRRLVFARRAAADTLVFVYRPRGKEQPKTESVSLPASPRVRLPAGARITDRSGNLARSLAAPTTEFAPSVQAAFQEALDATRTRLGFPGAIAGVWNPSGSWVGVTGVAAAGSDRSPGLSDHSRIGSVTKTFTAISLLQQVDKGLVSLDDPIETYVPGMPNGTTATLRMLASMTSGIPSYSTDIDFLTTYFSDTSTAFTASQLVDYARGKEPLFPAGTDFDYSNTNTVLLGMVIEQVTGRPIAEVFQTEIFGPLGMTGTSYPGVSVSVPSPHLEGITLQPDGEGQPKDATHWNPSWTSTAGALISQIDDLRIWGNVLGTGGGLISRDLQIERLASVASVAAEDDVYGLGFVSFGGWLGHNGRLPGYTAYVAYDPATETVIAVMANSDIGEMPPADAIAQALQPLVPSR